MGKPVGVRSSSQGRPQATNNKQRLAKIRSNRNKRVKNWLTNGIINTINAARRRHARAKMMVAKVPSGHLGVSQDHVRVGELITQAVSTMNQGDADGF